MIIGKAGRIWDNRLLFTYSTVSPDIHQLDNSESQVSKRKEHTVAAVTPMFHFTVTNDKQKIYA
jgi:hypothetical protein